MIYSVVGAVIAIFISYATTPRPARLLVITLVLGILIVGNITNSHYFETIWSQIMEMEVVMHKGLLAQTLKVVPYRTITGVEVKRGVVDRFLGLSTILIFVAGKNYPEEVLGGVLEPDEIKELILQNIRLRNPPYWEGEMTYQERMQLEKVVGQLTGINKSLEDKLK